MRFWTCIFMFLNALKINNLWLKLGRHFLNICVCITKTCLSCFRIKKKSCRFSTVLEITKCWALSRLSTCTLWSGLIKRMRYKSYLTYSVNRERSCFSCWKKNLRRMMDILKNFFTILKRIDIRVILSKHFFQYVIFTFALDAVL